MRHAAGRLCLTVASLIGVAAPVAGQSVVGRVLDGETERPVAGAVVSLGAAPLQAVSDSLGRFVIADVPAGDYLIRVEHVAYRTRSDSIAIPAERVVRLVVPLTAEAIALDPIDVTALSDAERIRRTGGHAHRAILTREDIVRYRERGAANVSGVLDMHDPLGIEVRVNTNFGWATSACVASSRRRLSLLPGRTPRPRGRSSPFSPSWCDAALVVLDGMPVPARVTPVALFDLPLNSVRRIEYVPPVEALVRFGGLAEHGAIVIATRLGETLAGGGPAAPSPPTPEALLERLRDQQGPEHWPYPVVGALIGVVAGTGYLFTRRATYVRACRSKACIGTAIARPFLSFAGAATLGALIGEIVFRIEADGSPPY